MSDPCTSQKVIHLYALLALLLFACSKPAPVPTAEPTAVPLQKAVEAAPDPRRAASMKWVDEGRKELAQSRFERAAYHLSRALEIDSSNPFAYYFLGLARERVGRLEEALTLLTRSVDLFAQDPVWRADAMALKAETLQKQGKMNESARLYNDALKLDPENARAKEALQKNVLH